MSPARLYGRGRLAVAVGRPERYEWILGLRFLRNSVSLHLVWWRVGVVWFKREPLPPVEGVTPDA